MTRFESTSPTVLWLLTPILGLLVGCSQPTSEPPPARAPAPVAEAPASRPKSGAEMVLVPAGEFTMGDEQGEGDEQPAHRVRLNAFYMDVTEVTQASFQAMMGRNPAKFTAPDKPVERISWHAAIQYCNMRSRRDGLQPCYDLKTMLCNFAADGYRLPTEAEWEYACRAGTTTRWSFGGDANQLKDHAWYKPNAAKKTHPVKTKRPNPWGLYDMHGNVAEWCQDFYAEGYGEGDSVQDPRGPAAGEDRVLRGGSWSVDEDRCRSSARDFEAPGFADVCFGYEAYGFRCVRNAASDSPVSTALETSFTHAR
jgi:formylglycine-generating enzyme required for sulfatase activity